MRLLTLSRPATSDLILTKMMRVDPQDRSDIQFLLTHLNPTSEDLDQLLHAARVPDIEEIHHAFATNTSWLRSLVR